MIACRRILRAAALALAALAAPGASAAGAAEVSVLSRASGLPSDWIRAVAVDGASVWMGTGDHGVVVRNAGSGKVTDFSGDAGFRSKEVGSLARFRGKLYAGTARGLMVHDGRAWERIDKVANVTLRNVALGVSPDGKELWAGAMTLAGGTVKFDGTQWTFMGGQGRGLFKDIDAFAFTPEGTWMGSLSGTVYLHRGGTVDYYRDGISGSVFALATAGNALYAGTSDGLFVLEGKAWRRVDAPPDRGLGGVFAIASRGEVLYLGTAAGLARLDRSGLARLTERDGLPFRKVDTVHVDGDTIYAGTVKGLAVVRGW